MNNLQATLTFHKLSKSGKSACVSIKRGLTLGLGVVGYVDATPFAESKKGDTLVVDPNFTIEHRADKDGVTMAHSSGTPFNYFVW